MIQLFLQVLIFFVMFFGIAFILNMLLRQTWFMSFVYPIVVLFFVNNMSIGTYFKHPINSITTAFSNLIKITTVDIAVLGAGFAGTIVAGIVMKVLRKRGYQMF